MLDAFFLIKDVQWALVLELLEVKNSGHCFLWII